MGPGSISTWRTRAGAVLAAASPLLWAGAAHGAGTTAGTAILNTATVTYVQAGRTASASASANPVLVAQLLNASVTWQDATPVTATSPASSRPLAFAVTNTGNGVDTFRLTRDNALAGDQFDPADAVQGAIWIESGAQAGFQATGPNADRLYVPGVTDLVLAADQTQLAYLLSDIPAGQPTGAAGKAALAATSTLALSNPAPGTQVALVSGVPAIVGAGRARGTATGTYLVSSVAIGIAKSVTAVRDPSGGSQVMSGSVLTYRLLVTATGAGTAGGITVTDPLPASLRYVPGSITVDGAPRSDAVDADDSSFSSGTVQTVIPAMSAPSSRSIEFKATVN